MHDTLVTRSMRGPCSSRRDSPKRDEAVDDRYDRGRKLRTLIKRLRGKCAMTPEQVEHLATIKFPCC